MIETIDVELNGFQYQVEVDVYDGSDEYDDYYESISQNLEVVDIFLVRKRNVYRVINEHIIEEINNLDLMEIYNDQCV